MIGEEKDNLGERISTKGEISSLKSCQEENVRCKMAPDGSFGWLDLSEGLGEINRDAETRIAECEFKMGLLCTDGTQDHSVTEEKTLLKYKGKKDTEEKEEKKIIRQVKVKRNGGEGTEYEQNMTKYDKILP
ncbi:hypothetical protein P7K49_031224 [Saguinus oedipus]|uniref:Uncharacterized protein n=1 Tax=Saguinus oedipus TaxID=9490 RepID=A0ABQ9U4F0_SAGOE|nr:hypothetical protein P7K49_031224 [Saguinus oedipus]